jgi:rhamnulose-1-phosphate aldolase
MAIEAPYPELDELLVMIGETGLRLSEIEATEGAAGNISVYMGWTLEPRRRFPLEETIQLPTTAPALAHRSFLVTGSGRRLREIIQEPAAHVGFITVNEDGTSARLYTAPSRRFAKLTSELNSHLAIHQSQIGVTNTNFHAVIHAQPPYLTYLSHIPAYRDEVYLNRKILRWEPELIVQLSTGIGHIPFRVPGSAQQEEATVAALQRRRIVIWGKHGVVACSDISVKRASDYIEYAETGARYEYLNLANQERGEGLTVEEIRAICAAFDVKQDIF